MSINKTEYEINLRKILKPKEKQLQTFSWCLNIFENHTRFKDLENLKLIGAYGASQMFKGYLELGALEVEDKRLFYKWLQTLTEYASKTPKTVVKLDFISDINVQKPNIGNKSSFQVKNYDSSIIFEKIIFKNEEKIVSKGVKLEFGSNISNELKTTIYSKIINLGTPEANVDIDFLKGEKICIITPSNQSQYSNLKNIIESEVRKYNFKIDDYNILNANKTDFLPETRVTLVKIKTPIDEISQKASPSGYWKDKTALKAKNSEQLSIWN